VTSDGTQANRQSDGLGIRSGASFGPDISADGRFVTFDSIATNLVADDTNTCTYPGGRSFPEPGECPDVFVRDRLAGSTTRVSVSSSGEQANDASTDPAIRIESQPGREMRMSMVARLFPFDVDGPAGPLLLLYGVRAAASNVAVDDDELRVHFGPWSVTTARSNIVGVQVTGPFEWWKAWGLRMSLADRGITFGSSAKGGTCVGLREPVSVRLGRFAIPLRHPGVTMTVRDPEALARALSAPAGPTRSS